MYSVAIITRNEGDIIAMCIGSVLRQTIQPDRIVVLNDGSTDNTARVLAAIPDIDVLTSRCHESYLDRPELADTRNDAMNYAARGKDTKYVLCLDGDIMPSATYAEDLLMHMQGTKIMIASGTIYGQRQPLMPLEPGRMVYMPWFMRLGGYPGLYGHDHYIMVRAVLDGLQTATYGDVMMGHLKRAWTISSSTRSFHYGASKAALGCHAALVLVRAMKRKPGSLPAVLRGLRCTYPQYDPVIRTYVRRHERQQLWAKLGRAPTLWHRDGAEIITGQKPVP